MANLRQAKIVIKNAQALELFMRIVPDAASFLDCFSFKKAPGFEVQFAYSAAPGVESVKQASACYRHLVTLSQHLTKAAAEEEPDQADQFQLSEGALIDASLALGDSRLMHKILEVTAQLINEQLKKNPHYTLCSVDAPELARLCKEGFDRPVSVRQLERLLPHMPMLEKAFREAKLPERYR